MNEVVEHIDGYEKIISMAIDKNPKIIVLNTFAVLPELDRDRLLWLRGSQCFMNSYSFSKFFCYLREKTKAPIQIFDFGTELFNRYWFPRKALIGWYIGLSKAGAESCFPADAPGRVEVNTSTRIL